ncbi:MAG: haloacid dehalogenase-like hydrolase [Actinobacteria bacterium]|nr:haloacid dehalogenase-like hydrolase [Actinomycetota bacterium]
MARQEVIAVIFDFDDTLAPDTTTMLLREHGIDTDLFWGEEVRALVERGYDQAVAWLTLVAEYAREGGPLEGLSTERLAEFGARVDDLFYPGLPGLLDDLENAVAGIRDVHVEFSIISGGLRELLEGSRLVRQRFAGVYASQLGEDPATGRLTRLKRVITFTEKTRYLFEINKGILPAAALVNPYLVNEEVKAADRRVPFENMIYVGDGLTDIPCFSLLKASGGTPFGVFDPAREESAKRAFLKFLQPERVVGMHAAKYGPTDELGALIRTAVQAKATDATVRRAQA